MKTTVVIPARLGSRRLPGKPLIQIAGRPLLWHVWSRVRCARSVNEVVVATEAEEIRAAVVSWGGRALMTPAACASGSERVASVLEAVGGELVVDVQADMPLIDPGLLDALVAAWQQRPCDVLTPVYRITDHELLGNPNVVKVVRTEDGRALYFSRSPVPHVRDVPMQRWPSRHDFWGHVGIYGFGRDVLAGYADLAPTGIEEAEKLEQLRFVAAGLTIDTFELNHCPVTVDTPADLARARHLMGDDAV